LCAWLALLPQALCIVYVTLIWSTREAEVALTFAGQLACEAANFALKRIIKEERPRRIHGKGYGMPSSHAQFVAFWSVSLVLFLLVRHKPKTTTADAPRRAWSVLERLATSAVGVALAAAVAWSRTYLNYHTGRQVLVGVTAGVVCAVGWYVVTEVVRQSGLLAWALEMPLAKVLRIRDLLVEEDPCQAGWEKWEARIRATGEKKER
jgi:dolichyldiphosphatase